MKTETMQCEEITEFTAGKLYAFIETGFDGESWRYRFGAESSAEGFSWPYQIRKHANLFASRDEAYQFAMQELLDRLYWKWPLLVEVIKDAQRPQQIELF